MRASLKKAQSQSWFSKGRNAPAMTYEQAAQAALDVQDACNLSGVVFAFGEAMHAVCDEQQRLGEGTDWKNNHAIVTLFINKLGDLNGLTVAGTDFDWFSKAYTEMRRIAEVMA